MTRNGYHANVPVENGIYAGQFLNNRAHGRGAIEFSMEATFVGNFKYHKKVGFAFSPLLMGRNFEVNS